MTDSEQIVIANLKGQVKELEEEVEMLEDQIIELKKLLEQHRNPKQGWALQQDSLQHYKSIDWGYKPY